MDAEYFDAVEAGDPSTVADAKTRFGPRRHDMVGTWPSEKLGELLEARPDLEAEIIRRRGGELTQL